MGGVRSNFSPPKPLALTSPPGNEMFVLLQGLMFPLLLYLEVKKFSIWVFTYQCHQNHNSPKYQNHPQLQRRRLKRERNEEIKQTRRKVEEKFRLTRTDFALFHKVLYCLQTQTPFWRYSGDRSQSRRLLVRGPARPC